MDAKEYFTKKEELNFLEKQRNLNNELKSYVMTRASDLERPTYAEYSVHSIQFFFEEIIYLTDQVESLNEEIKKLKGK